MRSARLMMMQRTQKRKDCCNNNPIIEVDSEDDDKPHFYKFIVQPLPENKHLRIPKNFVEKHGMHLSHEIFVNVPKSKQKWKVMLEKDKDDNLRLGKGWQAFKEFYNLEIGQILVFRLNGGSQTHFRVLIFDKFGSEIDYPVGGSSEARRRTNSARLSVDNEITEDDDVVIVDEDSSRSPNKHNRTTELVVNVDTSDSDEDDQSTGYKDAGYVLSREGKRKLLRKLDEIESPYPHFKAIMYPSYVRDRYKMSVTFSHAVEHFPIKSREIILKGPNGKLHNVKFYVGIRHAQLLRGWKLFVLDNQLKIGDLCVFELKDRRSHTYEVTILRR